MAFTYYLFGVLTGFVWGGLVAALKYYLIWRPVLKPEGEYDSKAKEVKKTLVHSGISFATNIIALFLVFYFRKQFPFSFEAAIISTAVALSLGGRLLVIKKTSALNKAIEAMKKDTP